MNKKAVVEHVTDFLFIVITGVVFFLVLGMLLTRGVGKENPTSPREVQTTQAMEKLLYSARINFEQGANVDASGLQKQLDYVRENGVLADDMILPPPGARMQK